MRVGIYNGSSWFMPAVTSPNATNIQATGVTTLGDIAIGEICNAGTTIAYANTVYCSNAGTAFITRTGTTGGSYTSSAGLAINATTGAVDLGGSTAGNYSVTYTILAAGGCATYNTTTNIIISLAPAATIIYANAAYCSNAGTATVAQTGTTGGTYSSTAGLSINATTGNMNPALSMPGTYTVSYTIAASGACALYTTTTTVAVTATPSATISYAANPYCSSAGTASVTQTGTSGGTYSSTAGLSINPATGAVNLGASTARTYTVTYTVAAFGGCAAYTTTANITITIQPFANGYYAGTPYCSNGGTVNPSGTAVIGAPGTLTSSPGLSINSATGAVNLGASTPGSYMITYTVPASGGCLVYTTTTPLTITPAPSATISYAESPYCRSAGTASVTQTGTTGGTYSSTTGLSINATTGGVNLAASTPGTYTITYRKAASGGCLVYTTTTAITVTVAPSATIRYTGSPYCSGESTASVTQTGTAGGTYSSTAGLSIHSVTGLVNIASSSPGMYSVTYVVAAGAGCSSFQTTATIAIQSAGMWTGAVSSDFGNAQNWLCGGVPTSTTNIVIRAGLSFYPVVTATHAVNDVIIEDGAILTVQDTLQVAGTVSNDGRFISINGTIEWNGTAAQQLTPGLFDSAFVKNLIINNPEGVSLTSNLNLTGVLKISAGQFNTGDQLTLKSTAIQTATVAAITSNAINPINGHVTVERYIPGRRKYRLITSSVTTHTSSVLAAGQESLSIWGNWQNGGNNDTANSGTIITGGSSMDGFDPQTPNASLFTYDDVNRKFVGYTSANGKNTIYTPLKAGIAYYMFVYGDRTNTVTTSFPNNTVVRATGTLLTGDQAYTTASAIPLSGVTGRFTLLGNPFASPINWATIPKTNLENACWGWDPNIGSTGGYVTVLTNGSVILQAPYSGSTGLNQYIQPGQGFFVKTTGPLPTLNIREQDKASNFNGNAFRINGGDTISLIAVNLYYPNGTTNVLADGVLAAFGATFFNKVGREDAVKLANTAENMAILNDTSALSIDARQLPRNNDTLFLNVSRLTKPQYTLQIFTEDLAGRGVAVFLQDRYLNTLQPLSLNDTNNIVINVNPGIAASADINRFRLVFRSSGALPVTYTSIKATRKRKEIQVDWEIATQSGIQKYEVERSDNGIHFIKSGEVSGGGNSAIGNYQWLDTDPLWGNNYYRVRAVQADGQYFFSPVVLVTMTAEAVTAVPFLVTVFPNPVKSGQLTMRSAQLEKGAYTFRIWNTGGQQVIKRELIHAGGRFEQVIYFDKVLPAGMYYLELQSEKGKYQQTLFVE